MPLFFYLAKSSVTLLESSQFDIASPSISLGNYKRSRQQSEAGTRAPKCVLCHSDDLLFLYCLDMTSPQDPDNTEKRGWARVCLFFAHQNAFSTA